MFSWWSPRTFRYTLETFLRRSYAICRQQSQPSESFDSRHLKATVREMRANEYESFSRVCLSHYITNVLPVVFDISRLESYTNFDALTLKTPSKLVADDILELIFVLFLFFFRENETWYFMWIVCRRFTWNAKSYLLWKIIKKIIQNVVCYDFA